jgi:hypothetical protein
MRCVLQPQIFIFDLNLNFADPALQVLLEQNWTSWLLV